MANRRNGQSYYNTYGNVAYAPVYDGADVRVPQRDEAQHPRTRQREAARRRALARTQVQVREAGFVSPFAVIGFLAVGVFAALLLLSYVQLTDISAQNVNLHSELSALQMENAALTAQYEQVFDITRVQQVVGDTMVLPSADQMVYIELSEPDTVRLFEKEERIGGVNGFVQSAEEIVESVVAYLP